MASSSSALSLSSQPNPLREFLWWILGACCVFFFNLPFCVVDCFSFASPASAPNNPDTEMNDAPPLGQSNSANTSSVAGASTNVQSNVGASNSASSVAGVSDYAQSKLLYVVFDAVFFFFHWFVGFFELTLFLFLFR